MENNRKDVVWEPLPGPVFSGDRITCRIGDVMVSGKVTLSPKAVAVEMDLPEPAGTAGRSLDCVAPAIFTETPEEGSPASWYGVSTAREILLEQYQGILIQKN